MHQKGWIEENSDSWLKYFSHKLLGSYKCRPLYLLLKETGSTTSTCDMETQEIKRCGAWGVVRPPISRHMRHCGWSAFTRAQLSFVLRFSKSPPTMEQSTPTVLISHDVEDSSNLCSMLDWDNMGSVSELASVRWSFDTNCMAKNAKST